MALTKKQKVVYDYIRDYQTQQGFAPTQKEIMEHFGLKSLGPVQKYLKYLMAAGYLQRDWNARRGLTAIPQRELSVQVPLYGRVAAGKPIEALQSDETVAVPMSLLRGSDNFALTVVGDSMIEDGILDGDIIVVRPQPHAEIGSTIVALIHHEATVKRFYREGQRVELRPANQSMKSLFIEEEGFQIVGIVIGLLRTYHEPVHV